MTARLAIQGIGPVGAFGCGADALREAIARGESPHGILSAGGDVTIPAYLADSSRLEEFVPKRSLRRIDPFSRLALLGACLALQDAGRLEADRSRLGVVIATGWGAMGTTFSFLDSFIEGGDVCSSPTHFSSSVHNAAAANISILLGATGPSLTVSQFEMSVPSALLTARRWLAEGRVDAVLAGGVDETGPVLGYCWRRFFGVPEGELRPLDFGRQSALPGEGASFVLLTREREAKYGFLTDIAQGNVAGGLPPLPGRLVLGADGHAACGSLYARHVPAEAKSAAYAPLWGSLPVGPAFDLAAAALEGGISPVGCLKFGRGGDYGLLTVEKG